MQVETDWEYLFGASAASFSASSRLVRYVQPTRQPRRVRAVVTAAPMPRDPPETNATRGAS
ncbi:hypothetical protein MOO23_32675 [Rhodococcus opacus]|nr:hypothetical protein [Rhodococcus opacus]UNN00347.1 hypothetical protein MOO23_32675 [Rhodococcus opacus]